ncbi:MAG: glycosyltransferase family 2 protein [Candidatus Moranbacteria bacterium]|nr:glycosyltransferase family 2 protein [Candidatus Moranbacteria bacterium]
MRLIVNIPALNEEKAIGNVIKKIPRDIKGIDEVKVQVINDGSTDRTAEVSREAGADIIVSHPRNMGIGAAFRTAINSALENGADIMVNIDADGQFPASDIPKFTEQIVSGKADMAVASRFGVKSAKNMPWIKSFLNRLAARVIGKFLRYPIDDLTCGFRALSRETMLRLNLAYRFTYTQETIIDAISKNLTVKWIPVEVTYFEDRQSRVVKSISKFVYQSFIIIIRTVRDARPMVFFGIPGLVLITASGAIGIAFLGYYFSHFKVSPFRTWLSFAGILLLIGIQLLIFALIADMIRSNRKLTEEQMYFLKKEKYDKKTQS